jgi:cold shock CspA family protein
MPVKPFIIVFAMLSAFASAAAFGQAAPLGGTDTRPGTVKSWNSLEGWGYLTVDGKDVVVDVLTVERAGAGRLVKGQPVWVKLYTDRKKIGVAEIQFEQ